jgi:hypothetical protein
MEAPPARDLQKGAEEREREREGERKRVVEGMI